MSRKKLGWRDILKLAESKYKAQMIESFVRWPPACNALDSKAAPPSFGSAHLSQFEHHQGGRRNRGSGSGSNNRNKGAGRGRPQGNRPGSSSGDRPKSKNPKFVPPDPKAQPTRHVNGKPVFEKTINGQKFEWCALCKAMLFDPFDPVYYLMTLLLLLAITLPFIFAALFQCR